VLQLSTVTSPTPLTDPPSCMLLRTTLPK
jgi:hypothetical protein